MLTPTRQRRAIMRMHFRNATIIDASGAAAFRGTVSVEGERIAAVRRNRRGLCRKSSIPRTLRV